ncbi:MAG: hypothetical protein HY042_06975 [Spirochaetia bacterium]|nr:hypothetical protein [Spirochaetia bacterium]
MKKFFVFVLVGLASMAALLTLAALFSARRDIPKGEPGPEARQLALKIESAVGVEEWRSTGTISFSVQPADRSYFWDRTHRLVEAVVTKDSRRVRILWRLDETMRPVRTVAFWADQTPLDPAQVREINAAFVGVMVVDLSLIFPWSDLSGPGHSLEKIGEQALLVRRAGGSETVLIITDKSGLPVHWKTWRKGILVQGVETIFESWSGPPGPRIARIRRETSDDVEIRDLQVERTAPDPLERFKPVL